MTKISGELKGDLQCTLMHEPTSSVIYTDAPLDNHGKGTTFSPTDLIAAAFGSCIATVLGIYAEKKGWRFEGIRFEVVKEMMPAPERRILSLTVHVSMPISLPIDDRHACERVAQTSPVQRSLHPGIEVKIRLNWPKDENLKVF